jgi:hypothetical protein
MVTKSNFFLFVLLLLVACKRKEDNRTIISPCDEAIDGVTTKRIYDSMGQLYEIEEVYGDSAIRITKFHNNGNVRQIESISRGKIFGDNEFYFRDGAIERYQFLVDSLHATFVSIYDEQGRCIEQRGTPLVFKIIGTNKKNDTLDIKFVFADKIFSSISSELSTDGVEYRSIHFEDCDSNFRFNKVYRHIQDISNLQKIALYFRTTAMDKHAKKSMSFYDTINLSKTR